MKLLILSCDKYEATWEPFFKLLNKYYPNHPEAFLATETKKCKYAKTLNYDSRYWTEIFREALKKIEDDYVFVMLDDFFLRKPVDEERINYALNSFDKDTIVFNFEKKFRPSKRGSTIKGFEIQKNNQIYLNSCQPSIWDRKKLLERLKDNQNPWEWEKTKIDSPYKHYINSGKMIMDYGKRRYNMIYWGIARGKLTRECKRFFKKEGLTINWNK